MKHGARRVWMLAVTIMTALAATGTVAVVSPLSGERPTIRSAPGWDESAAGSEVTRSDRIELAGSGSNLPLTRRLTAAYNALRSDEVAIVHDSIGSRGGVRAVHDGVIDLGLISRPLTPAEEALGLIVIPYARVPVVVAAHPGVPDSDLTRSRLLALYRGEILRWSDDSRIVVLQRERGDSSHLVFERMVPGFAEVDEISRREGRFQVLFHDAEMQEALLTIPGAMGLFDLGAIRSQALPLSVLSLDGVAPDEDAVAAGAYPFVKDLAFVARQEATGLVADFLQYVRSPRGRAITAESGYIPVTAGVEL